MTATAIASTFQLIGAGMFGAVVGWYLYSVNRYRSEAVKLADVATVLGAVGGAAVLALFPAGTELFGAYGIGLAIGFFAYFIVLCVMVGLSSNFSVDWFLDGRRKAPSRGQTAADADPTRHAMGAQDDGPPE